MTFGDNSALKLLVGCILEENIALMGTMIRRKCGVIPLFTEDREKLGLLLLSKAPYDRNNLALDVINNQ